MNDHKTIQVAIIRPTFAEAIFMLILMAMLILNLVAVYYAAIYEPGCVPIIMENYEN